MSANQIRKRNRLSPKALRLVAAVVAIVMASLMFVSSRRQIIVGWVSSHDDYSVRLNRGSVGLWMYGAIFKDDQLHNGEFVRRRAGLHVEMEPPGWDQGVTMAWRPYHHRTLRPESGIAFAHGLVIPLWQVTLLSFIVAGYAHGRIVGARRAAIGKCRRCGYDVVKLADNAQCPECGEVVVRTPVVVVRQGAGASS